MFFWVFLKVVTAFQSWKSLWHCAKLPSSLLPFAAAGAFLGAELCSRKECKERTSPGCLSVQATCRAKAEQEKPKSPGTLCLFVLNGIRGVAL